MQAVVRFFVIVKNIALVFQYLCMLAQQVCDKLYSFCYKHQILHNSAS